MQLPTKIGIAGAVMSVLGVGFGWGIFPWFLKSQIAKAKSLAPGGETRQMWEKVPFPITFKVHIFNVTNYLAVQNGDIPMLDEIGPYYFDEWKEKADVIDYEEDDTVTFHMKNTFVFNAEKSEPLTMKELVMVPHPAMVGMLGAVEREKPGVLGLVNKAIPFLFNQPETVFLKTTVYDLLFGGNVINCTSKEFAANAICTFLKKEGKDFEKVSDTIFKFSIFGSKNGTVDPNKFQVSRGIVDYTKVGEMVTLNGKKKMSVWRGKPCNDLVGTDSTIFPPFTKPEDDIVSFSHDLCRSIAAKFQRPSSYKGISTLRYSAGLGDMSVEPALKCFCINETYCLKKGVMDLGKCTGAPAIVSLPHFFDAHEDYVKAVRGLHPDEEKHGIVFDVEPMTGSPIYAKKRLQFSLPVHPINKIEITANLPTAFVPFMWVEEGVEISDDFVAKMDGQLFKLLRAVDIVRWLLTVLGGVVVGGGVGLYYKRQNNLSISPSQSANKKLDQPNDFLGDKKGNNDLDGGHNNYGYI